MDWSPTLRPKSAVAKVSSLVLVVATVLVPSCALVKPPIVTSEMSAVIALRSPELPVVVIWRRMQFGYSTWECTLAAFETHTFELSASLPTLDTATLLSSKKQTKSPFVSLGTR